MAATALPPSLAGAAPVFAQVMLRITSPTRSHAFYTALGMSLLTRLDFADLRFSLFFYAYPHEDPPAQSEPQPERARWLWAQPCPTVELTWNWPRDTYDASRIAADSGDTGDEKYVSGNEVPKGFAHTSVSVASGLGDMVSSLIDAGGALVHGVRSDEGGAPVATVADPDGYHVSLYERGGAGRDALFSGVKLRVKDAGRALPFFARLGFAHVARIDDVERKVSQHFLGYCADVAGAGSMGGIRDMGWVRRRREPLVQLEHVWGSEDEKQQMYSNGNVRPYRGFGHIGIVVGDIYATIAGMESEGYEVVRQAGRFKDVGEIGFVAEPSTGYWVEVIQRDGDGPSVPYGTVVSDV